MLTVSTCEAEPYLWNAAADHKAITPPPPKASRRAWRHCATLRHAGVLLGSPGCLQHCPTGTQTRDGTGHNHTALVVLRSGEQIGNWCSAESRTDGFESLRETRVAEAGSVEFSGVFNLAFLQERSSNAQCHTESLPTGRGGAQRALEKQCQH
ncbi:hypothetical protein SKAU_G00146690 [Synaphobranchus kaupii]|uniref:Uncharacterized protein n=1 Tax=Synaphobranchus kaupii TaxID=118154 RepID=A0A9Q1J4T5_SYNKA|nr:hypothetical protein SKAU_G00146690 [Synaphobranchus kaupii]